MKTNNNWELFLLISKINSKMTRKLDASLGGLGWNDFMVLYYLDNSFGGSMRRIDLADKIGLSASGVTRILLPMEKIGLIKKEVNQNDARVSLVSLTKSGKGLLDEAIERLNYLSEDIFTDKIDKKIGDIEDNLNKLYKNL